MNIALTFKNFEPSDHLRAYATRRFEKLHRFMPKSENVAMTVVLTVDKFRHKADVQVSGGCITLNAEEQSSDMYATVDMVLSKLETQLKKQAERLKEKKRHHAEKEFFSAYVSDADEENEENTGEPTVMIAEIVEPKPLFLPEAVLQFDQRRDDMVFVFINAELSRINILYRQKNGGMGLIDPSM